MACGRMERRRRVRRRALRRVLRGSVMRLHRRLRVMRVVRRLMMRRRHVVVLGVRVVVLRGLVLRCFVRRGMVIDGGIVSRWRVMAAVHGSIRGHGEAAVARGRRHVVVVTVARLSLMNSRRRRVLLRRIRMRSRRGRMHRLSAHTVAPGRRVRSRKSDRIGFLLNSAANATDHLFEIGFQKCFASQFLPVFLLAHDHAPRVIEQSILRQCAGSLTPRRLVH
jgi:hypothetical protein